MLHTSFYKTGITSIQKLGKTVLKRKSTENEFINEIIKGFFLNKKAGIKKYKYH